MNEQTRESHEHTLKLLIEKLIESGVVDQNQKLIEDIGLMAERLEVYGKAAVLRLKETENIAAHVLAIEALLIAILRQMPISRNDLLAEVQRSENDENGTNSGSSLVMTIAEDILKRSKDV